MTDADDRALVCPGCDYDLRGLPDGACPECGRGFTRAELLAGLERRRRWSWRDRRVALLGLAMWLWMGVVLLLLGLPEFLNDWGRDAGSWGAVWDLESRVRMLAVSWGFTLLWCIHWLIDRPKRSLMLLWVWIPTLRTLLLLAALRTAEYRMLLATEAAAGFVMLAWPFWREPRKSAWVTAALLAAIGMPLGTMYLLSGLAGLPVGEWSNWEDFRPGQVYDQYPLTNSEGRSLGFVLIGGSTAVAVALAWTYRWVWRSRAG